MLKKSENYRSHHADIRLILSDIKDNLTQEIVDTSPDTIASHTRKLFGKFGMHLALEDKAFYPRAMESKNAQLSETAKRFQDEMGGLSIIFADYRKKWPGPFAIAKDPSSFISDTKNIIEKLEYRLEKEENELYDLFDQYA